MKQFEGDGNFVLLDLSQEKRRPEVLADLGDGRRALAIGENLVIIADAAELTQLAGRLMAMATAVEHTAEPMSIGLPSIHPAAS